VKGLKDELRALDVAAKALPRLELQLEECKGSLHELNEDVVKQRLRCACGPARTGRCTDALNHMRVHRNTETMSELTARVVKSEQLFDQNLAHTESVERQLQNFDVNISRREVARRQRTIRVARLRAHCVLLVGFSSKVRCIEWMRTC
jgi:hypothetical protein